MNFLAINVAEGANRTHARSALPDAPVVPDQPRRRPLRTALRALRTALATRDASGDAAGDAAGSARAVADQGRPAARHTAHKPAESC